jgi:hypothetical protein
MIADRRPELPAIMEMAQAPGAGRRGGWGGSND